MTQKELADALGINQSQVSRYCARGMPLDLAGAKDWISRHIRLTMKAPLYRRQTRALQRQVAPAPKVWTVGELHELAEGIAEVMLDDADRPHVFREGLTHLLSVLGDLARMDEDAARALVLPARVADAVQAFLAAP